MPARSDQKDFSRAGRKREKEQRIRDVFEPDKGGGWGWTTYEQKAPNGDTIGGMGMLCCPICGVAVVAPDVTEVLDNPDIDWPSKHIEYHVQAGH